MDIRKYSKNNCITYDKQHPIILLRNYYYIRYIIIMIHYLIYIYINNEN